MSGDMDVPPHPHEVAALVESLVASEWPTSEAERLTWFQHHGLDARDSRREWGDDGVDSFGARGPERWGSPRCGWHTFEGEFVGVNWFLWLGGPPDAVGAAARELCDRFSQWAGEPVERVTPDNDPYRFTALWEVAGRTIDMYLHGGPFPGPGRVFVEDPVVQLHVDHTARSHQASEAASLAQHDVPPSGAPEPPS